jgi:dihydroorotate dehydrogenase electron transfer subunit
MDDRHMQDVTATVVSQAPLAGEYLRLALAAPAVARNARPGQFVHVRVPGIEPASLRRPFSIYDADGGTLVVLYKTVGRGTEHLARLVPGAAASVLGPLGNGFPEPDEGSRPVLVAGGYGVAPLAFLARRLAPRRGVLFAGGRTAADVLCLADFAALGWETHAATDDGSLGVRGLVTAALDPWLAAHAAAPATFYACGPRPMLRAVGERARAAGRRAWLSVDKHMVCGVGACLACVQTLRRADGTTWIGRVCRDGPVFEASEIVWENRP